MSQSYFIDPCVKIVVIGDWWDIVVRDECRTPDRKEGVKGFVREMGFGVEKFCNLESSPR